MTKTSLPIDSIGFIRSPFQQKLGIPRQPGLAESVESTIYFHPSLAKEEVLRGLDSFSHLWVLYLCHASESWRETIRPPRLGGKAKMGVFATRSPHRPNPIGLSVVKIKSINPDHSITILGADILDNTPLIDIKPYLPMWDSIPEANNGWVEQTPQLSPLMVEISQQCQQEFEAISSYTQKIIIETLRWDPRPAYTKDDNRTFTHTIDLYDITWRKSDQSIQLLSIKKKK
jgi:tRNA (adenine37-N6)-methyltransferase